MFHKTSLSSQNLCDSKSFDTIANLLEKLAQKPVPSAMEKRLFLWTACI